MPNRRSGKAPYTADVTTAGVPNTSAELRTFSEGACAPVYVVNNDADTALWVAIGGTAASATNWQHKVAAGERVEITEQGLIAVHQVSLWSTTNFGSDYTAAKVYGFND